ncbi:MAG: hypothetical protein ACOCYE_04315 [Pseudomonadota bacterium]
MPVARRKTTVKAAAPSPAGPEAPPSPPTEAVVEAPPRDRVGALRTVLFDTIEKEVREGNVRVILWLADRLKILETQEQRASPTDELRTLLDDLSGAELREFVSLAGK